MQLFLASDEKSLTQLPTFVPAGEALEVAFIPTAANALADRSFLDADRRLLTRLGSTSARSTSSPPRAQRCAGRSLGPTSCCSRVGAPTTCSTGSAPTHSTSSCRPPSRPASRLSASAPAPWSPAPTSLHSPSSPTRPRPGPHVDRRARAHRVCRLPPLRRRGSRRSLPGGRGTLRQSLPARPALRRTGARGRGRAGASRDRRRCVDSRT